MEPVHEEYSVPEELGCTVQVVLHEGAAEVVHHKLRRLVKVRGQKGVGFVPALSFGDDESSIAHTVLTNHVNTPPARRPLAWNACTQCARCAGSWHVASTPMPPSASHGARLRTWGTPAHTPVLKHVAPRQDSSASSSAPPPSSPPAGENVHSSLRSTKAAKSMCQLQPGALSQARSNDGKNRMPQAHQCRDQRGMLAQHRHVSRCESAPVQRLPPSQRPQRPAAGT